MARATESLLPDRQERILADALPDLFHDLNNHLNRINLAASTLQRKLTGAEADRLDGVRKEVRAAAEAIRWWQNLKELQSRSGRGDLRAALTQATEILGRSLHIRPPTGDQAFEVPFPTEDLARLLAYLILELEPVTTQVNAELARDDRGIHLQLTGSPIGFQQEGDRIADPSDASSLIRLASKTLLRRAQATLSTSENGKAVVLTWQEIRTPGSQEK